MMVMVKYSQSTQGNKFAISLQYLKQEVRDGVHFLHTDNHQSFYKLVLSVLSIRSSQTSKHYGISQIL